MTNAQSKYAVCPENYPPPLLTAKAAKKLVRDALRDQGWEITHSGKNSGSRKNIQITTRYEVIWDWHFFKYYVRFSDA